MENHRARKRPRQEVFNALGMFQRVGEWLTDKSERFVRGGAAQPRGRYYGTDAAEQAYSARAQEDAEEGAEPMIDPFGRGAEDEYGGRVPYRSQKDIQQEQWQAQEALRRQAAAQQRAPQPPQPQPAPAGYAQPPQAQPQAQPSNVVPFPGMAAAPDGSVYAHIEYIVLLRSRSECTRVIEYIKANASVFLNMEFIANDSERQRCVDMLSGAAYTLGCKLNKISQRGIYLISSPSVNVIVDQALQKFSAQPEAQGYAQYAPTPAPGYEGGFRPGFTRRTQSYAQRPQQAEYAQPAPAPQAQPQGYAPAMSTATFAAVQSRSPAPPFGSVMPGTSTYPPVQADTARYSAEY